MIKLKTAGLGALLALAGCDQVETGATAPASNATSAQAAPPAEKVLKSETVDAVFTGWEVGDYVWAKLDVKGRGESGAWVGPTPLEHFLEAHKGKPISVTIKTVRVEIPEAGGEQEVPKIAEARVGPLTAVAWWRGLSPAQRQAAERRMEEVLGGGA